MEQKTIRLCYRKIIDSNSIKPWEKMVFDATYTEFLMQAQFYNQQKKYLLFSELLLNVANAQKLHFLISAAAIGYVKQLNGVMPDIINVLGKSFLKFDQFKFEIIESHIHEKQVHRIALNFFSEALVWHNTIGNMLLVSAENALLNDAIGLTTDMFQLQPFLSICSLKTENYVTAI